MFIAEFLFSYVNYEIQIFVLSDIFIVMFVHMHQIAGRNI